MTAPLVSFVIPVRNDAHRLARCLQSIAAVSAGRGDVEIIVADNGSTDGSADVARAEGAAVIELAGFKVGALRNRAAAIARGAILAFVDADHEIAPGWIAAASEVLADPAVGGAGAPYVTPTTGSWARRAYGWLRPHSPGRARVDWLGSGNLAVRRAAFLAAGGFDVSLDACEDVDLCRRLRAMGLVLVSDSRMVSVHHGDPDSLTDIFAGELWRGRDNIRVSLRQPRTLRTVASALAPALNLAALVALPASLFSSTRAGLMVAACALGWLVMMVLLRTVLMASRKRGTLGARTLLQAAAVATAYEAGRTLALVARAGHGRRRGTPTPAAGTVA